MVKTSYQEQDDGIEVRVFVGNETLEEIDEAHVIGLSLVIAATALREEAVRGGYPAELVDAMISSGDSLEFVDG